MKLPSEINVQVIVNDMKYFSHDDLVFGIAKLKYKKIMRLAAV